MVSEEIFLWTCAIGLSLTGALIGIIWSMLRRHMESDKAYLAEKIDDAIAASQMQITRSDEEIGKLRAVRHEDRDQISSLMSAVNVLNEEYRSLVSQMIEENREMRKELMKR